MPQVVTESSRSEAETKVPVWEPGVSLGITVSAGQESTERRQYARMLLTAPPPPPTPTAPTRKACVRVRARHTTPPFLLSPLPPLYALTDAGQGPSWNLAGKSVE
jgi:hypothetical protein